MSGKIRPALLNQVLEELNIMERQAHPALGKAKRDCIRELVSEKLIARQTASLTLEELRGMDGEPVYIARFGLWVLINMNSGSPEFIFKDGSNAPASEYYEVNCFAYRRPPEE